MVGDDLLPSLESVSDAGREDVEQQGLRPLLLGEQQAVGANELPASPDRLPEEQHGRQESRVGDGTLEDQHTHLLGQVGDQGEDDGTGPEPDGEYQRPQSTAASPSGSEGH